MKRSILTHALAALAGFLLAWYIHRPVSNPETAAPAVALPSGGLVLERAPEAPVPQPVKVAAKEAGGKLERAVSVTVQPKKFEKPAGELKETGENFKCSCEPVTVDLGLIRMPDDTRRIVATSDGEVVGGVDIPIVSRISKPKPWAVGGTVSLDRSGRKHYGAFVDRDAGPFRFGAEVSQRDGGSVSLRAGIRF